MQTDGSGVEDGSSFGNSGEQFVILLWVDNPASAAMLHCNITISESAMTDIRSSRIECLDGLRALAA
ncbi:hypothetical protein, partial [Mesorhizobium sp. M1374]|uniref:hypothetical protein n=1 Tax=Mesorhizobium sp. M1374 TaxID=2957091 RepID=UPI00333BAF26